MPDTLRRQIDELVNRLYAADLPEQVPSDRLAMGETIDARCSPSARSCAASSSPARLPWQIHITTPSRITGLTVRFALNGPDYRLERKRRILTTLRHVTLSANAKAA